MGEYRSQIKPLYGTPRAPLHWANQGLVGAWDMNEGSGLIAHDSSGNGNDGLLIDMSPMSPTSGWVPGPHGGALAFDESNDYVSIPDNPLLQFGTGDFTIVVSFRANVVSYGINDAGALVSKNNIGGLEFFIYQGILAAYVGGTSNNPGPINISTGLNYMAVLKRSSAICKLFLSGNWGEDSTPNASNVSKIGQAILFGNRPASAFFLNGSISSVSIANVARQPDEIAYLNTFPWCGYEDEKGMQEWLFNQNATAMQQIYRFYSIGAGR